MILKSLPKFAVYLLLFLIPIFTLPFTGNTLDFQKQFLLFAVASLGFLAWLWNVLSEKKLGISRTPLHFFVGIFAAAVLVSSIFSLYSYGSLWGTPLPVAESFITILGFILLYFLVANNFRRDESYKLIAVVAVSAAIAAVYGIIQSFGIYVLPFLDYSKSESFNTIGTANSLSLFSAIVLAVVFPLIFSKKNPYRILMGVSGAVLFCAMVFLNGSIMVYLPSGMAGIVYDNFLAPWIALAAGALAVFIFSTSNSKLVDKSGHLKNISFSLLFVSLLFVVFNVFARDMMAGIYRSAGTGGENRAVEAVLRQQTAAEIAVSVLKQSSQAFIFGSGPGTFVYDYVKFKPQSANRDNSAWNLTFFSGSSEVINRVATTGLLGIAAFLLLIGLWTVEGFRALTSEQDEAVLPLAVFGGWVAVVVAAFYYPFNVSLALLFWFFLGLIIIMDPKRMAVFQLNSVRLNYAVALIFVLITVSELGLLVWNSKRYYAEVQYLEAARLLRNNDLVGAVAALKSAVNSTDRLQDNYLTGLSQIYLAQANQELNKQGSKPEEALQAAAPYFKTAMEAAMLSTDMANPSNSANWAVRGFIYRQLIGVSDGFDTWALNTYQKAVNLEPNNPVLWVEIGQVYAKRNEIDKAKDSFNRAISLRNQYIDPHYYLALIFDQQGDKDSAIKELEAIAVLLPVDDKVSRENVAKAIQSLKEGKSLAGNAENQQPVDNMMPQGDQQFLPGFGNENAISSSSTLESVPPIAESASNTAPIKP